MAEKREDGHFFDSEGPTFGGQFKDDYKKNYNQDNSLLPIFCNFLPFCC